MRPAERKLGPAVKWHGGKTYLAREIIAHFGPHGVYCEPFAGGLAVLLNKPRAAVEVAGDLDRALIDFYQTLVSDPEFRRRLRGVAYNRETFDAAAAWSGPAAFLIRNRFSRGGLGKDFAWSDRLRGGKPGDVNAWESFLGNLDAIADRLRDVRCLAGPAVETIRQHDGPETLFYVDPPYVPSTRTVRNAYRHEMTVGEHAELLDALASARGSVFLSGYRNPLYDAALGAWERAEWDMPNHSGQGRTKQRRIECLWIKRATKRATQGVFFDLSTTA